jgi:hypothetical protein
MSHFSPYVEQSRATSFWSSRWVIKYYSYDRLDSGCGWARLEELIEAHHTPPPPQQQPPNPKNNEALVREVSGFDPGVDRTWAADLWGNSKTFCQYLFVALILSLFFLYFSLIFVFFFSLFFLDFVLHFSAFLGSSLSGAGGAHTENVQQLQKGVINTSSFKLWAVHIV